MRVFNLQHQYALFLSAIERRIKSFYVLQDGHFRQIMAMVCRKRLFPLTLEQAYSGLPGAVLGYG